MMRKPPLLPIASSVLDTLQLDMATLLRTNLSTSRPGQHDIDLSATIPVPESESHIPTMHQLNNIIPPTRSEY